VARLERSGPRRLAGRIPDHKRPAYSLKEIRHWLQVFTQRFYSFAQFKRSAMPNGRRYDGGSLSPRGDWRAPSDMSARTWLDEIEREVPRTESAFVGAGERTAREHMAGHRAKQRAVSATLSDTRSSSATQGIDSDVGRDQVSGRGPR